MDLSGIGTLLLGIAAIGGVIVNWRDGKILKKHVKEVRTATNGMSQKLQDMAESKGYKEGHDAGAAEK